MSTDYKAMLESTSNHQPTVSSTTCTVLLCCPFCGSEALYNEDDGFGTSLICCEDDECLISACITFDTSDDEQKEVAIRAWNKRAS